MITRDEVVARSYQWPERSIAYSMIGLYGGYRRDCSGYISYCLGLPAPGYSTVNLPDVCTAIAAGDMRPGDLIGNLGPGTGGANGHVQLFLGWTATGPTIAEQAGGMLGPWHHDIKRITPGYGCWRFNNIMDVALPNLPVPPDSPVVGEEDDMGKITPLGVYQTKSAPGGDGIFYAWISDGTVYYADTVVGPALFPTLAKAGFDTTVIYLPSGATMANVGKPAGA
jgi:hypothetical protein